jgi:hypothetical protein
MTEKDFGIISQPKWVCPIIEVILRRLHMMKNLHADANMHDLINKTMRDLEVIRTRTHQLTIWGTAWMKLCAAFWQSREQALERIDKCKRGEIDLVKEFETI